MKRTIIDKIMSEGASVGVRFTAEAFLAGED